MITQWDIYLIMQMDNISKGILLFSVFSIFCAIVWIALCPDNNFGNAFRLGPKILLFAVFLATASAFIPSSKTLAAMYTVPAIVNSEKAQKLGGESIEVLELGLARLKEVLEKEGGK